MPSSPARQKQRHEELKRLGRCVNHPKENALADKTYCQICLDRIRQWHRHRTGWSSDLFKQRREEQNNKCAICAVDLEPEFGRSAASARPDHDHNSGKARMILCNQCNLGLGLFFDDPFLLRSAADYVDLWKRKNSD